MLLSNQKCLTEHNLINLHPKEYSQELDRCFGSFNTHDLSNKLCVLNKTKNLNLSVFNMITGINESKTLTKHKSCECRRKVDGRKCSSDQWWNND